MHLAATPGSLKAAVVTFLALTLLPFLMNAFPRVFAGAFSEHVGKWSGPALVLMAATLTAWVWAAVRLGRKWRRCQAGRAPAMTALREIGTAMSPRWRNASRRILICHGPILVALFYLMWFSARLSLGRWPRWGGADDPKSILGTSLIYWTICVWFWAGALALAVPLFRAGAAWERGDNSAGRSRRDFVATALLLLAACTFISSDPHHLLTWFMD